MKRCPSPVYHPREGESASSARMGMWPLIFLTYYGVSGGAFGMEQIVQAAGPLYALLGFSLIVVWSFPEALVTAELSSGILFYLVCGCTNFNKWIISVR